MIISILIIILIAVLLVLMLATPLFCPFSRKIEGVGDDNDTTDNVEDESNTNLPPISVIITVHDNSKLLNDVIDSYLNQDYTSDCQFIFVIDNNDEESESILKSRRENSRLYYTKLPVSSRYLSRKKLAITIGMRAAKHPWCIVTSIYCKPSDDKWLRTFASYIKDDTKVVVGLTPYESSTKAFYRYEQLRTMLYHLKGLQSGNPFSTTHSLIAIRKDDFFENQGFRGNLEYQRAEYEFLLNKFAQLGPTVVALAPQSRLTFRKPTRKQWYYRHMHIIDALSSMSGGKMFRFLYRLDLSVQFVFNLLILFTFILGGVIIGNAANGVSLLSSMGLNDSAMFNGMSFPAPYDTIHFPAFCDGIILVLASILIWVISVVIRCLMYKKTLRYFANISPLKAVFCNYLLNVYNLRIKLRYWMTDKYDFRTHRL